MSPWLALLLAVTATRAQEPDRPPLWAPRAPEVSLALGIWPQTLSVDARAWWPLLHPLDAGVVLALGPTFFPAPIRFHISDDTTYALAWVDARAGFYLRHRWQGRHLAFTPALEAVVRGSYQYVLVTDPSQDLDRDAHLFGRWLEVRPSLRLEWRVGSSLGWRWAEPVSVEAQAETAANGIFAAYTEARANLLLKWTFRQAGTPR